MNKLYYVYILTNKWNTVLYTGVTNDLLRRVQEHKENKNKGFSSWYRINKLVYYEVTENIESAILREKQIKGGSRKDKTELVKCHNSDWRDLSAEL